MLNRRGFIGGLLALVAAPAIVKATSLMPVKALITESKEPFVITGADGTRYRYVWDQIRRMWVSAPMQFPHPDRIMNSRGWQHDYILPEPRGTAHV